MHFGTGKSRDETCRACRTAQRDTLITTSATGTTRTTRGQGRRHSVEWVDMSTSLFPEVVPEIDANPDHIRLNLYTREHYCFFVVCHVVRNLNNILKTKCKFLRKTESIVEL